MIEVGSKMDKEIRVKLVSDDTFIQVNQNVAACRWGLTFFKAYSFAWFRDGSVRGCHFELL